jgi:hypothetical protein
MTWAAVDLEIERAESFIKILQSTSPAFLRPHNVEKGLSKKKTVNGPMNPRFWELEADW